MEIDILNTCFKKSGDVIFRKIADEFILVPIRQKVADLKSVYTLNEVGAFIWDIIDSKINVSEIKNKIIEKFDAQPSQVESDMIEILSQLEALDLIQKV